MTFEKKQSEVFRVEVATQISVGFAEWVRLLHVYTCQESMLLIYVSLDGSVMTFVFSAFTILKGFMFIY